MDKYDRRCTRLTGELLLQKLGLNGVLTSVKFNHKTNTVEVYFLGEGGFQVAEGMETPSMSPEKWAEVDDKHLEKVEEELINQWESD